MRHGFRTQTPGNCHPDGELGRLQIYQFSNNAINRTGERLVQIIATNLIQAVYGSFT